MYLAEEWLEFERNTLGKRPLISGSVEEVRAAYAQTSEQLAPLYPPQSAYRVRDDRYFTNGGVDIRVYRPTTAAAEAKLPVLIFAHGGGHVNGGAWASSFEDRMCRHVCHHADVVVAQVDFRLAPENLAPAQLNDTFDAYKWCYRNAHRIGGDTDQFFAAGSSLGGTVAVGVALKLIDENCAHMVRGVVALCPALVHPEFVPEKFVPMFKSYTEAWTGVPLQDGQSMLSFFGYNGSTSQRMNPYVFPALHPGLSQLPPVYQAICEADPVRDDSNILKSVLDEHGIPNMVDTYPGMPHYFWIFPQLKTSEQFHEKVVDGVKWLISAASKM